MYWSSICRQEEIDIYFCIVRWIFVRFLDTFVVDLKRQLVQVVPSNKIKTVPCLLQFFCCMNLKLSKIPSLRATRQVKFAMELCLNEYVTFTIDDKGSKL
ncbi:hypothetical protein NQ318_013837 [Aromia moschata]|uniref:Uncharacterized protein n=1 Tax=Aromia moschata TaxID=1265417 RepID=A0AAV8Z8F2_9CUCU|nr:hypothetical protein NQ318_013837 [Aromia moschata]